MFTLEWNYQGLGNPGTVRVLHEFMQCWDPKFVFLAETKMNKRESNKKRRSMSHMNCLFVLSKGQSGGLAMIWTKDTSLDIVTYDPHHINAIVTELEFGFKWRVIGFYGHSEMHQRHESWKLLTSLHHQYQLPWLCLGDFNEIVSMSEKQGGTQRSQNQMDGFRNVINLCNLRDLGYNGSDFTWCNKREGVDRIYVRLDRVLATDDWRSLF